MIPSLDRPSAETSPAADRSRFASAATTGYIPTLDGWRAIAVGLVVASHTLGFHGAWREASGALGVSIFFGISGYLICSRLLDEIGRSGGVSLRKFYVRRAFRILPPAFAYLAVVVVLGLCGVFKVTALEVSAAAFFFRNYAPGNWYTSHFWSLAVEEHFYLFFPALLVGTGAKRAKWYALGISLATAAWRIVDTHLGLLTRHMPDGVYAAARTDFRLDGLMLGCLAALVLHERHLRVRRWIPMVVCPAAAAILAANVVGVVPLPELLKATLIVVMLVSACSTPDSPLGRVLELPALRWVGRLSYSLYLWQQMFFVKYETNLAPALSLVQKPPLCFLGVFALATLSYYALERPLIKLGHRFGRSPVPSRT